MYSSYSRDIHKPQVEAAFQEPPEPKRGNEASNVNPPRVLLGRLHHPPLDIMHYQLALPLLDIILQYRSQLPLLEIPTRAHAAAHSFPVLVAASTDQQDAAATTTSATERLEAEQSDYVGSFSNRAARIRDNTADNAASDDENDNDFEPSSSQDNSD